MAYPQTIQIFLPDGNPRGIKIAEITNRTIKAILFPRNQFEAILQRPELANVGFYFLFGVADNGHEMAYIGEAEDCAERLKQHQRNKDFWNYAVVIISQTHAFTKTHVKYLEYVAIKKASETGRYDLDNSAIPNRPHITESMEADAEDCFEIAKVLLSTLGFPLFDSVAREVVASTPVDVYKLKGNGVEAEGSLVDDGFVVFKDSKVKATTVPSCHDYLINMRNELIQSGILTLDGEAYRFTEDYIFSSPSTAGGVILGRSTNGWTKWRTVNGKTLDEMKRQVN
ncbi:GIY-YIG nuclease family protein [Odoribacter laneus]|uniref:GIY-YIG nuclease family protein n=1 Tax=Odoribacter laneus TaxID=626933 RepID=UPI003992B5D7